MYQRDGILPPKMDLTKTLALSEAFGNPHLLLKTLHIAGTNGKGSVSHILASICTESGLKTGLYTSPHYRDFRERIKINGQLIPENEVVKFVNRYRELNLSIQPSFFELTVVMAFDYFASQKVDVAVIETGLGGRLDSTNVIQPLLSIITNISFDHMSVKQGVPVVIGELNPQTSPVFIHKASETDSLISFADQNWQAVPKQVKNDLAEYEIFHLGKLWQPSLKLDLTGEYQKFNIQTVLEASRYLKKFWDISDKAIVSAFARVKTISNFFGRWEVLNKLPLIIADSAHNEGGIKLAMKQLLNIPAQKLHIVMGIVKDKDPSLILSEFPQNALYYFAKPDIPRGLDADKLKEIAAQYGLNGQAYASVGEALNEAKKKAHKKDVIFVGGSSFVVAEVV